MSEDDFNEWWAVIGSGLRPTPNEDAEEFAQRVCFEAWQQSDLASQPEASQFPCSECGESSVIRYSGWTGPEGEMIGKDESLCPKCARKRRVQFF